MTSPSDLRDCVSTFRHLPVPRERVFRAWSSPEELAAWWRPGRFRAERVVIDLRAGGGCEILMADPEGARQRLHGVYVQVLFPERLIMTWNLEGSPADDGYTALLSLEFMEERGGTLLRLSHERLRPAALGLFDAGWEALLPRLAGYLQELGA